MFSVMSVCSQGGGSYVSTHEPIWTYWFEIPWDMFKLFLTFTQMPSLFFSLVTTTCTDSVSRGRGNVTALNASILRLTHTWYNKKKFSRIIFSVDENLLQTRGTSQFFHNSRLISWIQLYKFWKKNYRFGHRLSLGRFVSNQQLDWNLFCACLNLWNGTQFMGGFVQLM